MSSLLLTTKIHVPQVRKEHVLRTRLLARSPQADPESVERELDLVLGLLERDGYLMRDKNTCVFRSFLLRDYWRNRFA